MKTCTKCKVRKGLEEFDKDKTRIDGIFYWCKSCQKERASKYYKKNKDKVNAKNKEWQAAHKEEMKSYNQKPEVKARTKAYHQTPEVKAKQKAYQRTPEAKAKMKAYHQSPRGKAALKRAWRKRRAKKLLLKENFTAQQETFVIKSFNNECYNCKSTERLHVDHHNPLSKGNPLTISNAAILCKSCNSSKNNKDPIDFYSWEKWIEVELKLIVNDFNWEIKKLKINVKLQ